MTVEQDFPSQSDLFDGPGRLLQQTRLARGIELEKVAARLHLKIELLSAIEQDADDQLPSPVFTRGYLKNYARFLDLDPEPFLQAYDARQPAAASPPPPKSVPITTGQTRSTSWFSQPITWLLLTGLAVVAMILWQLQLGWEQTLEDQEWSETEMTAEATLTEQPEMLLADDGVFAPPQEEPTATELLPDNEQMPVTTEVASSIESSLPSATQSSEPAVTQPDVSSAPTETPVASDARVVFQFIGTCWVDIKDASGEHRIIGTMTEGDQRALQGTSPFSVVLGNRHAVKLIVDGKAIGLERFAQGAVARFRLDPDAL